METLGIPHYGKGYHRSLNRSVDVNENRHSLVAPVRSLLIRERGWKPRDILIDHHMAKVAPYRGVDGNFEKSGKES